MEEIIIIEKVKEFILYILIVLNVNIKYFKWNILKLMLILVFYIILFEIQDLEILLKMVLLMVLLV